MRQYEKIKSQHPGVILLFRVGDFYETFNEDAKEVSEALGIVLTKRANGAAADVPMAGFPHHSLESHVARLVKKGYRVAICEQMEDPKFARGVVKREVVDIITPGVNFSDRLLDEKKNNYLCAVHFQKERQFEFVGVAFIDVTTAEFQATEAPIGKVGEVLQAIQPSEIIVSKKQRERKDFLREALGRDVAFTEQDEWQFSLDYAEQTLRNHFKTHSLKGFGIEDLAAAKVAAAVILNYLEETQRGKLQYIRRLSRFETGEFVALDPQTKRNLELVASMRDGSRDGTLLDVMDKTQTAMGARLFKKWLSRPSRNLALIQSRLNAVEELVQNRALREESRSALKRICDLERALSRIATGRATPREVLSLGASLRELPALKATLSTTRAEPLRTLCAQLDPCADIADLIERAISPDAPANVADGGVIKSGFNAELDDYRHVANVAKDRLLQIQTEERDKTGIASLKVLYNKVFGYYIEVSNANRAKVPAYYERKQTMANAERYTIPALKELESKILAAEEKMGELEARLFQEVRLEIAAESERLQQNAVALATLDCLASLAECAAQYGYVKPVVNDGDGVVIKDGRHPVLERLLPEGETYVPNDCALNQDERVLIITGPNMAGKSSYLRQVGLIVLLAQVGSFVPASSAEIGLVDKIFTRVGASDNLAAGESTFLVEMNEAANILNNATERSLILLDEIGRGTSTYDGMSIAWAITEHIHDRIGAKTLFATHYHELAELETHLARVRNYNATVAETADKVIFLRKIARGAADNSYGIEVAKMAGLPPSVIERAKEILAELEAGDQEARATGKAALKGKVKAIKPKEPSYQISLFEMGDSKLKDALRAIDVNKLTPIEALMKLVELKRLAESD
ncbi:MAG: DNA mismatch repair protein MutS [Chloroherpetonaceae bacterium]|nr:DNA mismatch repair protein MutS [Chloroherpetonaceae bacterium]MDW8437665.1 DNA mismatch repair protein MutS [Chloroherpetonaceae bacterium]